MESKKKDGELEPYSDSIPSLVRNQELGLGLLFPHTISLPCVVARLQPCIPKPRQSGS